MKFLESFNRFKKNKEEFKGKKETYRFTNIHDGKDGKRIGRCRECNKNVDIAEHTDEECLKNYSL